MNAHHIKTHTERETMKVAEKLALLLNPGDVITLEGELGSGKTVFSKGIANGLGIKRAVTSPTFTIIKEYEGELPFYHMDAYRLEHSEEDMGFDEYFRSEEHTSELQSRGHLVCRLLLEKKNTEKKIY